MALSALDDKSVEPVASDVARVLGPSGELWYELIARMEASYGPLTEAWGFSGAKYGGVFDSNRRSAQSSI